MTSYFVSLQWYGLHTSMYFEFYIKIIFSTNFITSPPSNLVLTLCKPFILNWTLEGGNLQITHCYTKQITIHRSSFIPHDFRQLIVAYPKLLEGKHLSSLILGYVLPIFYRIQCSLVPFNIFTELSCIQSHCLAPITWWSYTWWIFKVTVCME
jgi:hypothetical protein